MEVLIGGPVETTRGFVLHSPDFHMAQSTLPIDDGVCLTATIDILRALARGEGPKDAILALGYAGWSAGQLENEIQANGWLNCPADADLLFGTSVEARYDEALRRIGVEPAMLLRRGRPRLKISGSLRRRSTSWRACSIDIGSPKTGPCAYSQPSW